MLAVAMLAVARLRIARRRVASFCVASFCVAKRRVVAPEVRRAGAALLTALAVTAVGALAGACGAAAAAWPSGPIRIVVPFPPGGTTDQIARRVQPRLQADLKVPVIVDNRSGASGAIGTQAAVTAPPDGTTFLLTFDTHAVNPSVLPGLPYDTLKDLTPVMLIGTSPMVITAHQATPYRTFAGLVEAARQSAGAVSYGTIGTGSLAHLAMSSIASELKVTMTHVPYRGGGPLVTDAIAGHVPVAIASVALLSPQIATGALRALAVTSAERYAGFPDVASVRELGLRFEAQSWWGLLAPSRTPQDVIARMHQAMARAIETPAVRASLAEQGVVFRLSPPDEFGRFVAAEVARWGRVVRDNRILAE